MKLENISIVMVGTTHPGNVGAAARAMRNMCINQLVMVSPKCPVGEVAFARASGAHSILDQRRTVDTMEEAIQDCELVIASTARSRSLSWPELSPSEMAKKTWSLDDKSKVAIVFGREHSGLTNEELQLCNYMVSIPSNPDFSSLNVASAIQVMCYEIYKTLDEGKVVESVGSSEPTATSFDLEGYFQHLEQVLLKTGYLKADNPRQLLQRLRRLYQRAELSKNEVNILRGILSSIEKPKT
ncbi:MAG: tRNA (cytidine32/uridine32-2'-O)-methyltransferase [Urechidicola sp.]|jgi:TrmH family RNA methyltransferase